MRRTLPMFALLVLVATLGVGFYVAWPLLPAKVAVHFDLNGKPNGWSSKPGLIALVVQFGLIAALIASSGAVLRRLPETLVSLPNKSYWLSPERRTRSFDTIEAWLRWLAVLVMALLTAVMALIVAANVPSLAAHAPPAAMLERSPLLLSVAFLVPLFGMIGWLYWRFRKPHA